MGRADRSPTSVLQVEEPLEGVEQAVRRTGAALAAERRERRMEQLRGIPFEGLADLGLLGVVESGKPAEEPVELSLAGLAPAGP